MIIKPDVYRSLTKSERNCYSSIEALDHKVLSMTLVELANECNVSTATIKRTITKLGYKNLKDFKQDIEIKPPTKVDGHISEFELKLCDIINNYDILKIKEASRTIINSNTVFVVGFGITTSLAFDFVLQLRKFAINAIYINDSDMLEMIKLSPILKNELIIYVSYSGNDSDMAQLSVCQKNQRTQMLITAKSTNELEENCDIILNTHTYKLDGLLKSRIPLGIIQTKIILEIEKQKTL